MVQIFGEASLSRFAAPANSEPYPCQKTVRCFTENFACSACCTCTRGKPFVAKRPKIRQNVLQVSENRPCQPGNREEYFMSERCISLFSLCRLPRRSAQDEGMSRSNKPCWRVAGLHREDHRVAAWFGWQLRRTLPPHERYRQSA